MDRNKLVDGTNYVRVDDDEELTRQESVDPDLADIPRNWFENATIMRYYGANATRG